MISNDLIQRIKQIPIADYLQSRNTSPVKQSGKELIYYSPLNQEATPSFMVCPTKNVFHNFSGEGEKGDIIRLVQYLDRCSFVDAVKTLQLYSTNEQRTPFSFSGQPTSKAKQANLEIVSVQPLRNRVLVAYVESRRIPLTTASIYLNEVHYQLGEKHYYAVGFRNEKGGYALRNAHFKNCTSPNWFTLIPGQAEGAINVFEGIFDFLSCCRFFNVQGLNNSTIILNSLSFINDTSPILSKFGTMNAFLDNDKSGKRALERLMKEGLNVRDCSHYYLGHKDFNEFLMA